jgi:hypothetical protein
VTFVTLLFALTSYAPAQTSTPKADFVINCAEKTLNAPAGTTVAFQLSLTPLNGFDGSAALSCVSSMPGVTCEAPSGTVRLGPTVVVPFEITAKAGGTGPAGTYPIIVTVKGSYGSPMRLGNVSHTEMLYLTTATITP